MKLLEAIKTVCQPIMDEQGWTFETDEARMTAGTTPYPCIYFEEYYSGSYSSKYRFDKSGELCLCFVSETPADADAAVREAIREEMEAKVIQPFISGFMASGLFRENIQWRYFNAPPRFRNNEVAVILVFESVLPGCL